MNKKQLKKQLKVLLIFSLFTFNVSQVSAGMFDLENSLNFGLGIGYNTDHFNRSEIAESAFMVGGVLEREERALFDNLLLSKNGNTSTLNINSSGEKASLGGFNIDAKVQYEIFSWLFARTGFVANISLPVEHHYERKARIKYNISGNKIENEEYNFSITNRYSGVHMEIPVLLGFNLLKTEKSLLYVAAGINIMFGGFNHEMNWSQKIGGALRSQGNTGSDPTARALLSRMEAVSTTGSGADVNRTITNEIRLPFTVGLYWLAGVQYEMWKNISIFAEIRQLKLHTAKAATTGTNLGSDPNDSQTENIPDGEAAYPLIRNTFGQDGAEATPVVLKHSADLNRTSGHSVNADYLRWAFGINYRLNL